ncbi:MAG: DNA mismatch repair endonuclease MutL, partial [Pseudobutyrivibrio sp.]|nr:DNA mismatch repair endonuclease MutL [Pseudobutyrivibrio sp.]
MGKINLLSQETIDKIAAGEVVERPASVAKELIENSIDAGATAISVEIKGGGIEYLRITDNGSGIEKDQIQIAFLRHSTSKIADASDLASVRSLGFRGEALSSISAVSKVELITKTKDSLLGASYIIEGAKEISLTDIGAPNGTTFIVRQLFFNTPARKKFLKSESTEGSYVFDVVEHLALSHPEISFKFLLNGKEKLMTSGNGSLSDTIYQIYGRQIASNVLDIDYEDDKVRLSGFIGQSVIARGNRAFEHFFVNNRYIKSNHLSKACEEGYYGFLMGHQYPFFVINIDFDADVVDVNVHPTKQEVRFEDEAYILELLTKTINNRLRKREDVLEAHIDEPKPVTHSVPLQVMPEATSQQTSFNADYTPSIASAEKQTVAIEQEVKPIKMPEPFERDRLEKIKAQVTAQIRNDTPYE